jgi:hypothetical protein
VALYDYAEAVVIDEWPLLANGQESDKVWATHDQLCRELDQMEPRTPEESEIRAQLLEEMRDLDHNRRERLLGSEQRMPDLLWVILVSGGVEVVLFTYLFGTRRVGVQAAMTGALAVLFGLILFLSAELNSPFVGYLKVQLTAYQSVLDLMSTMMRR